MTGDTRNESATVPSPSPLEGEGGSSRPRDEPGEGTATNNIPSPADDASRPPLPTPSRGEGKSRRRSRRRQFLVAGVLGVAAAVAAWFLFIREPEPRNDLERFRGDWQIVLAGRTSPNVVRVEGDRWAYQAGATEGKAYRVTLNENADPKEIDLEPLDTAGIRGRVPRLHGIYAFDGRTAVRVSLSAATEPRPKSMDDDEAMVWTLLRVKLEIAPPQPHGK